VRQRRGARGTHLEVLPRRRGQGLPVAGRENLRFI
jgi:hypothetical protein